MIRMKTTICFDFLTNSSHGYLLCPKEEKVVALLHAGDNSGPFEVL